MRMEHRVGTAWRIGQENKDASGRTPVWYAAECGKVDVLEILLSSLTDNQKSSQGLSRLFSGHVVIWASLSLSLSICVCVYMYVTHFMIGIDESTVNSDFETVDGCDNTGLSPLMAAVKKGHLRGVEHLLPLSKDPFQKNEAGFNCLHIACCHSSKVYSWCLVLICLVM